MSLRTITFDDEQWQVVPKEATMYQVTAGATHSSSGDHMVARGQAIAIYDDMLAAAPEPKTCFCDARGIGDPAKSCGDCPQDYGIPTVRANPEPPAQQAINQCDGCRRGLPVNERGIHRGEGYDLIACTAHLYRAPAPQPITDDADPDAIVAPLPVPEVGEERQAMIDQLRDQAIELDMLREALGVPYEPHQSLLERMLEAARGRAGSGAAPEPPAQQPMSRDREVWRAALTLANNICVQESDRYNDEDATREASATGHCAQRIRDWIAPTDEQLAEMFEEAGIGKGESDEG